MIYKLLWFFITFALVTPPLEAFFQSTMSHLMLIQIPALIGVGFIAGKTNKWSSASWNYLGLSGLIFFIGSLSFWMLPHSLDEIIFNNWIKYLMYLNMLIAGFLLEKSFSMMNFILKITFGSYFLAMLASMGILYVHTKFIICGAFTIEQQWLVGRNLLWISGIVFVTILYWGGYLLQQKNIDMEKI